MLLYEVARHNFNSFKVKDYDIEQMNFGTLGLLVVKGMDNFKEATNYRTVFEQDQRSKFRVRFTMSSSAWTTSTCC